eukprot:Gb_31020 [translate_table: standard]
MLWLINEFLWEGIGICYLVLLTESVGCKWRGQVCKCNFFFFTSGFLILPGMVYLTRTSWRHTYIFISTFPIIYSTDILPFIIESPWWLDVRGRIEEAMWILRRMAEQEKVVRTSNNNISRYEQLLAKERTITSNLHGGLYREWVGNDGWVWHWNGILQSAIQCVENLDFNLYFTVAMNAIMESSTVFVGCLLMACMDHRLLVATCGILGKLSCITCILLNSEETFGWPQLVA